MRNVASWVYRPGIPSTLPPVRPESRPVLHHVLPTVFVTHRHLHPTCRPAHVVRADGRTLLMLDPTSLRAELVFWSQENLTEAERITLRAACGLDTDLSQPVPDDMLDGELGGEVLAAALRLPEIVPAASAQQTA